MIEHNNRAKANKFAEYITGQSLRHLVAERVRSYAGLAVVALDGAAGSGQLLQHCDISHLHAIEIQPESAEALRKNFPTADVHCMSFFQYPTPSVPLADVAVMNPPFSLKFKEQTAEDQEAIREEFSYKRSGMVDDIFYLKALRCVRRWAVFILFPGLAYRQTERHFRQELGNSVVELSWIKNAFEDTSIEVLMLIVDKQKTSPTCLRTLYDCKTNKELCRDEWTISPESWERIAEPQASSEVIDPVALELQAREASKASLINSVRFSRMVLFFSPELAKSYNDWIDELCLEVQHLKITPLEVSAFSHGALPL